MRHPRSHLVLALLALFVALLVAAPAAVAIGTGTIAFQGKRGSDSLIFTIEANGGGLKQWGVGSQPAISRDGKTIVFVKATEGGGTDLWARNSNGANLRRLTDDPGTDSQPSITANGQKVVFLGFRPDSGVEIYSIDIEGTDERQLTHGEDNYSSPSVSSDGSRIVYLGTSNGSTQVKSLDLDSGDVAQLTKPKDPLDELQRPSFSPDGKRVVFAAEPKRGQDRIYICDAKDGSDRIQLPKGDGEGSEPAFSPNGTAIAFRRGSDIFTMNLDGTGVSQVTGLNADPASPLVNLRPSWGQ